MKNTMALKQTVCSKAESIMGLSGDIAKQDKNNIDTVTVDNFPELMRFQFFREFVQLHNRILKC